MRTVSGIQPTGNLHLGNYLGAIRNWVKMQDEMECCFFLADLHAITVFNEPATLRQNCREMAAALIACGVDPDKAIVFNQTRVPEHTQMAWLLNSVARLGWLDRMTQFKEKSGKHKQRASVGLYAYPVLQAADVLLYSATHVPVGEDQKQHLELARDIAQKFNHDYGVEFFVEPEPIIQGTATRIMSLRDGSKKMSKSDPSDMSRIHLTDSDDDISKKVKKAKTDPEPLPEKLDDLNDRPEALNLVTIFAAMADKAPQELLNEYAGQGFGQFKPAMADFMVEKLRPIRERYLELTTDHGALDAILDKGGEKARAIAAPKLAECYDIMGLLR